MKILDEFNCQYCNKKVVLETESIDIDINRYDVDCSCKDCYNSITLLKIDYDSTIEFEWNEIQKGKI